MVHGREATLVVVSMVYHLKFHRIYLFLAYTLVRWDLSLIGMIYGSIIRQRELSHVHVAQPTTKGWLPPFIPTNAKYIIAIMGIKPNFNGENLPTILGVPMAEISFKPLGNASIPKPVALSLVIGLAAPSISKSCSTCRNGRQCRHV